MHTPNARRITYTSAKPQPQPAPSPVPEPEQDLDQLLLEDIRQIFADLGLEKIRSRQLLGALCNMPDRPWSKANKGQPITDMWLAVQLRSFGLASRTLRFDGQNAKGYLLSDFKELPD